MRGVEAANLSRADPRSAELGTIANVIVNGRALGRRITGVERYAREVTVRLSANVFVAGKRGNLTGWRGHLWEQLCLPRLVVSGDLLWSPANTGPLAVRDQVLTVHDVAPLDHPEWFNPLFGAWYRWLVPRLARRVRCVITDSLFSKRRILARTGIPEQRVKVVPPGVDNESFRPVENVVSAEVRAAHRLHVPYVLAVGTLDPRKGLDDLVAAWRRVRSSGAVLAIAGGQSRTLRRYLRLRESESVRLLGYVSDTHLPALYSGAAAVVLPSKYEGFGLPVLEAMACGAPVVAACAGALPEVAGDAAILVPPGDPDTLAEALETVLCDESVVATLRTKGFERSRRFDWSRTAQGVWNVLAAEGAA